MKSSQVLPRENSITLSEYLTSGSSYHASDPRNGFYCRSSNQVASPRRIRRPCSTSVTPSALDPPPPELILSIGHPQHRNKRDSRTNIDALLPVWIACKPAAGASRVTAGTNSTSTIGGASCSVSRSFRFEGGCKSEFRVAVAGERAGSCVKGINIGWPHFGAFRAKASVTAWCGESLLALFFASKFNWH